MALQMVDSAKEVAAIFYTADKYWAAGLIRWSPIYFQVCDPKSGMTNKWLPAFINPKPNLKLHGQYWMVRQDGNYSPSAVVYLFIKMKLVFYCMVW